MLEQHTQSLLALAAVLLLAVQIQSLDQSHLPVVVEQVPAQVTQQQLEREETEVLVVVEQGLGLLMERVD